MVRYQGKNAWWFIIICIAFNVLPLVLRIGEGVEVGVLFFVILGFYYILGDVIMIPILCRNYIEVYDDYFVFYYGFSKKKVLIKDIIKLEKTNDMSASSANSLDRIYIETHDNEFMVSLKKNDEFITLIKQRKTVC